MQKIARFILTLISLPLVLIFIMVELCIWAYDDCAGLDCTIKTINNLSFDLLRKD